MCLTSYNAAHLPPWPYNPPLPWRTTFNQLRNVLRGYICPLIEIGWIECNGVAHVARAHAGQLYCVLTLFFNNNGPFPCSTCGTWIRKAVPFSLSRSLLLSLLLATTAGADTFQTTFRISLRHAVWFNHLHSLPVLPTALALASLLVSSFLIVPESSNLPPSLSEPSSVGNGASCDGLSQLALFASDVPNVVFTPCVCPLYRSSLHIWTTGPSASLITILLNPTSYCFWSPCCRSTITRSKMACRSPNNALCGRTETSFCGRWSETLVRKLLSPVYSIHVVAVTTTYAQNIAF